jgi:hypothetical protein
MRASRADIGQRGDQKAVTMRNDATLSVIFTGVLSWLVLRKCIDVVEDPDGILDVEE